MCKNWLKIPNRLGKISENRRGDFFDSHCIREILQPKPSNVYFTIPSPTDSILSPNFVEEDIRDVITCFKSGDDRFRGLALAERQILPFLIDFDGRLYNTVTLPCERVIWTDEKEWFTSCDHKSTYNWPLGNNKILRRSNWSFHLSVTSVSISLTAGRRQYCVGSSINWRAAVLF